MFNKQNNWCWSSITTFLTNFMILTISKTPKLTQILYTLLLLTRSDPCIRPEMKTEWEIMRSNDCDDSFAADATANIFSRTCCAKHKKHDKREPGLCKEEFKCSETLCLCDKTYCCYDTTSNKLKFSNKGSNKWVLEQSGDGPLQNPRKVLDVAVNIKSRKRDFRTEDHSVATYEQTKTEFSYFYPKKIVKDDGIHTHLLNL